MRVAVQGWVAIMLLRMGTWKPLSGAARQVALEILLDGPLSRAELARRVRLSAGSLTRISKPMLESGLLVEVAADRGYRRFCLITIGAGIGFGLVVHDKPVETAGGGLVSHVILDPDGPLCELGHRGCASSLLTTEAMTSELSAALGRPVGYDEGLDLAKNGDPAARQVINTAAHALGRLIAVATNFTMPELVVLGGEGVTLAAIAYDKVVAGLRSGRDPGASLPPIALQEPTFTEWARGAAVIAIQTFVLGEDQPE